MVWEAERRPGAEAAGQSQSPVSKKRRNPAPTWSLRGDFTLGNIVAVTIAIELLLTSGGASAQQRH